MQYCPLLSKWTAIGKNIFSHFTNCLTFNIDDGRLNPTSGGYEQSCPVDEQFNKVCYVVMRREKRGLLTVTWCQCNLTFLNKNFVWSQVWEKFLCSFHEGVWIRSVINLSFTLCIGDVWLPAVSIAMFWGVPTNCKELAYRVFIKRVLNSTLLSFPLPWPVLTWTVIDEPHCLQMASETRNSNKHCKNWSWSHH